MSLVERIESLCNSKGLTIAALERAIDLSNGSIRRWETNKPSVDKLAKVADYFCVSVDYLLGRDDVEDSDPDIQIIRRASLKMDNKQKEKMMDLLRISFDELFKDEGDKEK